MIPHSSSVPEHSIADGKRSDESLGILRLGDVVELWVGVEVVTRGPAITAREFSGGEQLL